MSRAIRLITAFGLILTLSIGGIATAQSETGTVTVIHGVPGLTVDVYVNGDLTLASFEPDMITDPIELPVGSYHIDIRVAGADAASGPAISGSASVSAGINATIIAHLTADGTPSLAVFTNDVSPIDSGDTRLTVRHAAAAPEVDIWVDGSVVVESLANGAEAALRVPAATYNVAVSAAGTTNVVLGPADFELASGTAYFVYAVGSLTDGSLNILVQAIPGLVMQAPPADGAFFPQTGYTVGGNFLKYWERFGGLAIFGYPISDQIQGDGVTIQHFERARFELRPGSWPERYDIHLGLLGAELTIDRVSEEPFQPVVAETDANCTFFAETGHRLCNGFKGYWEHSGGLAIFGYPISEEFMEVNPDTGEMTVVQYFERQRFEWHPGDWPERYDVLLGRVGAQAHRN